MRFIAIGLLIVTASTKKIIAVGCSHVYGSYTTDTDDESCHDRSWANKILKYYKNYECVNLAAPGGSNTRSSRVIKEYVLNNLDNINDAIVFFGITDPSRIELASYRHLGSMSVFDENKKYYINKVGSWNNDTQHSDIKNFLKDSDIKNFLKLYYGRFYVEEYAKLQLHLDLISLHIFLKNFKIEHYFIGILITEYYFDKEFYGIKIPLISWDTNAIEYARTYGFKVGRDIEPNSNCNHLDHDGNIFLAKCIYNKMQEIKHAN